MKWLPLLLLLVILLAFVMPSGTASAGTYGSGTYGSCQFGSCSITLTSSGSLALNVTPAAGGRCTIQTDPVSVQTEDSNGYTLSLTTSTPTTAMTNGAHTISATTGTQASPQLLGVNQWGYRVDNLAAFGAGPTNAVGNGPIPGSSFAGVPASNATPDVLANSAALANPAVTTQVWYGLCADPTTVAGTYTNQVTYTAIGN